MGREDGGGDDAGGRLLARVLELHQHGLAELQALGGVVFGRGGGCEDAVVNEMRRRWSGVGARWLATVRACCAQTTNLNDPVRRPMSLKLLKMQTLGVSVGP